VRGHSGPLTGEEREQIEQIINDVLKEHDPDYNKSDQDLLVEAEQAINQGNYRVEDSWSWGKSGYIKRNGAKRFLRNITGDVPYVVYR